MWIDAPGSAKNTLSRKWANTLKDDDKRFGHTLGFEQSRQVETVTIEQLIIAHGSPFFIKIDVEGHELSVLRGMRRPFLIFRLRSIFRNLGEKVWSASRCWRVWPRTASSTTQLTVGEGWYWTVGLKKRQSRLYLIQARTEV